MQNLSVSMSLVKGIVVKNFKHELLHHQVELVPFGSMCLLLFILLKYENLFFTFHNIVVNE